MLMMYIQGESLERQAALVKKFAAENFLKLNVRKCEVVVFGKGNSSVPECMVDNCVMPVSDVGKCLGYTGEGETCLRPSVLIKKARRASPGLQSMKSRIL
jgi:hypothetical protein